MSEYGKDLNATQAATRAGYSPRTANEQGARLLAKASVKAAVQANEAKRLATADLSAVRILEEARRLALLDPAALFDTDGQLLPILEMSPEARACIAGLEVVQSNLDRTDGKRSPEWLHKIKLSPKVQAIELLMRHFKLLTDIVQVETTDKQIAELKAAQHANAEAARHRKK